MKNDWEYQDPNDLQLAFFFSIYSLHHSQLRCLKTTPVRIERMIQNDPIFRAIALRIYRNFCYEMGLEIEKMTRGELQCSYIHSTGIQCARANEPGSYRCSRHYERE
jgi:hypothetical protein